MFEKLPALNHVFNVTTTRPLSNLHEISMAEHAQTMPIQVCNKYPVAVAENTIREEYLLDVDHYHDLNVLDFDHATLWFNDGSSLTFCMKKKRK